MLRLRPDQFDSMLDQHLAKFEDQLTDLARRRLPRVEARAGAAGLRQAVRLALAPARRHGFQEGSDVIDYLGAMASFGSGFEADPLHPWAAAALGHFPPDGPRAEALQEAVEAIAAGLGIAAPGDGPPLRVLCAAARAPFPPDLGEADPAQTILGLLAGLDPTRLRVMGLARVAGWIPGRRAAAASLGLSEPAGWALHCVLGFLLGSDYARDPLHPWAAAALARLPALPPGQRAAALHAAARAALRGRPA